MTGLLSLWRGLLFIIPGFFFTAPFAWLMWVDRTLRNRALRLTVWIPWAPVLEWISPERLLDPGWLLILTLCSGVGFLLLDIVYNFTVAFLMWGTWGASIRRPTYSQRLQTIVNNDPKNADALLQADWLNNIDPQHIKIPEEK